MSGAVTGQREIPGRCHHLLFPCHTDAVSRHRGTGHCRGHHSTTGTWPEGAGPGLLCSLNLSGCISLPSIYCTLRTFVQSFQEPREGEGSRQRDMPPALAVLPLKPHSAVKQWASARLPSLPGTWSSTRGPAWLFLGGAPADSQGAGPRRLHCGG